jgi:hypothetical protein
MKSEEALEQELQDKGLTFPRVTPGMLDDQIARVLYHVPEDTTLTICTLVLQNGYTVTAESACADPRNFDPQIGRDISYENARKKIWQLEGYALKSMLTNYTEDLSAPEHDMTRIAKVCHEVNRVWCMMNGDFSQPSWTNAPQWQIDSALLGVQFHMDHPDAGDAASHNSWLTQKINDGWSYGETKDPELKQHPCMVPFEELPEFQQKKDALFRSVIHALLPG